MVGKKATTHENFYEIVFLCQQNFEEGYILVSCDSYKELKDYDSLWVQAYNSHYFKQVWDPGWHYSKVHYDQG